MTYAEFLTSDFFDTRDLIEALEATEENYDRYNELQEEIEAARENNEDYADLLEEREECEVDYEEHQNLLALAEECEYTPDYQYGETVIAESYFTEYTKDLLIDCGYIPKDLPSWIEIDFEATAENVKIDYHEFSIDGSVFFVRC